MASTFRPRDDNLLIIDGLGRRSTDDGTVVDPQELLGLAEYLLPLGAPADASHEASRDDLEAILEWADHDAHTLRRAWMVGVQRCAAHEVRRGTVELLASALRLAEEEAMTLDVRRERRRSRRGARVRATSPFDAPLGSA
jgi:hypothetical protein